MPILTSWLPNKAIRKRSFRPDGHNLNVWLERAADALRLPDWDAKIANLSGGERRRGVVPPAGWKTRHAAARRTDQPPGCGIRSVAGALPARLRRQSEAITHDRYFLDNVAGWIGCYRAFPRFNLSNT